MQTNMEEKKKPLKVILDSNAFFVPLQFKIDIFEELKTLLNTNFEPIILSSVQKELESLTRKGSPKMRKWAIFALELTKKCNLIEANQTEGESSDDIIVKIAHEWDSPVFTNDRQLKKRLRDINVPVIYVRQKKRLEIEGRL